MPEYLVLEPIEHLNMRYEPGEIVELDEETAKYHGERLEAEAPDPWAEESKPVVPFGDA